MPVDAGPPLGGSAGTTGSATGGGGAAGAAEPPASPEPLGAGGMVAPPPDNGLAGFGAAGLGDLPPPPSPFCDGMPKKPLPYAIAADFPFLLVLNSPVSWSVAPGADCAQTVFPDVAPDIGAGADATDGGIIDASPPTVTSCVAFRYDADDCVASLASLSDGGVGGVDTVAACWAGVIFTPSPEGISQEGICIASGATAIHFKARASRAGARVKFGSIRAGLGSTEFFIALTTAWADYTVSIPAGEDYDGESPVGGVWDGFSVVAEPEDHVGGTYIFVSDVVWAAE